jgi:hypothetical protein
MQTLQDLITRRKLRMTVTRTANNPNMERGNSEMDHWRCTLRSDSGARIIITFSMGSGHQGKEPQLAEVLDCLASDACGVENAEDTGFEGWAEEYGYSSDSRKAERTYKACQRTCDQLKRLVGADYVGLIFETERL